MDRVCDDIRSDVQTIEQCQAQCAGRYQFMGLACPRAGAFECWCCAEFDQNSASRTGVIPTSECNGGELTSGVNNNRHDHCSGFSNAGSTVQPDGSDGLPGYVLGGYYLGGHCRAAIYDVGQMPPPPPPPPPPPAPSEPPAGRVPFANWQLNVCYKFQSKTIDAVMHEMGATGDCHNGSPVYAQQSVRADSFKFVRSLCAPGDPQMMVDGVDQCVSHPFVG